MKVWFFMKLISLLQKAFVWIFCIILMATIFLLAPGLGLYYLGCGFHGIINVIHGEHTSFKLIFNILFSFGKCIGLFFVEWKLLLSNILVNYEFSSEGISLLYFGRCAHTISWDALQEVCVCYADYNATSNNELTKVICFIQKGEKKNVYGRWKVDNFLRFPKVIRLNYSSLLYEQISNVCPLSIVDYS